MPRFLATGRRPGAALFAAALAALLWPVASEAAPRAAALTVSVTAKPGLMTASPSARITWKVNAKGAATFTCRLDGGTAKRCSSPFRATGLKAGAHSLKIAAKLGKAKAAATVSWTVDLTAPTLIIAGGSDSWANVTSVTINAQAGDAGAGVATVEHRSSIDGGTTWGAAAAGTDVIVTNEGTTLVEFRATDRVGNATGWTAPSDTATAAIDRTAPPLPTVSGVPTAWSTAAVTATGASTDAGLVRIEHRTSSDAVNWSAAATGATFTQAADGTIDVEFRAIDHAGNASDWTTSTAIQVDATAPDVPTVSGVPAGWSTTAVTAQAAASDATSGVKRIENRTSTNGGGTYGAPATGASVAQTTDGVVRVEYRAIDNAGNTSAWSSPAVVQVDMTAPAIPTVDALQGWQAAGVTATATSSDAGSGLPVIGGYRYQTSLAGLVFDPATNGASFTQSTDGVMFVQFAAVDVAGNMSAYSTPAELQVDTTAPAAPLVAALTGWQTTSPLTATAIASDATSGIASVRFATSADGTTWLPDQPGSSLSQLTDGTTYVRFRASDNAGNSSGWSTAKHLQLDMTKPDTPSVTGPAGWQTTAATASATSADATSGVAGLENQLSADGSTWSGAWSAGSSVTRPTDGATYVRFRATDNAGLVSDPSPAGLLQVDATPPAAPSLTAPTGWQTSLPVTATATAADATSGIASVVQETSPDGASWSSPTPGLSVTQATDGEVYARFMATDSAGNTSPWSVTAHLQVDTTAPATPSMTAPSGWQTHAVTASATATDATSGIAGVFHQTSVDGSTWPGSWTAGGSVAQTVDGATYVRFRAVDQAGLTSTATAAAHLQVDSTPPTVPATSGGAGVGAWSTVAPVTVDGTGSVDPTSGVARYERRASSDNGTTWTAAAAGAILAVAADGRWLVEFRAVDNAGNASGWSADAVVWLDATAPSPPSIANASASWFNAPSRTVTASSSDATSGVATYSYETSTDFGAHWSSTVASSSLTVSVQDETQVRFHATDAAGNTSGSTIGLVRIDRGVPADPTLSGIPVGWSTALHATVTASSAPPLSGIDHYIYQTSTDNSLWTTSQTGDTIEVSGEGSTYVRFLAFSGAGTPSGSATGTVQLDRTGPTPPVVSGAQAGWQAVASETVTASGSSDTGAGGVVYSSLTSSDNGTTWSTPTAGAIVVVSAEGTTLVDLYAIDAVGNISAVSEATVMIDRTAPTIPTIVGVPTGWATSSVTVHASASDALSGIASYELETSSDNSTWSAPATGAQLVDATEGDTYVRFRAIDQVGNASQWSTGALIQLDSVAPTVPSSFTGTGAGWQTTSPVSLDAAGSADATSTVAGYEYRIAPSAGTFGPSLALPATVTVDGAYDVQLRSFDVAGNRSSWSATQHLNLDTVPPAAPALAGATIGWSTALSVTITPSSADATSGVASFTWQTSTDNLTWSSAGTSPTLDVTAEGTTYVQATATDTAGLTSAPSTSATVQLDRSIPTTPTVTGGGASWHTSVFDLTASATDAVSSVAGYEYQSVTHGGLFTGAASPAVTGTVHVAADGDTDYRIRAVDAAGNASAWSTTTEAMLDTTAPGLPTLANPAADVWTNTASETVTATSSDATSGLTGSFAWETSTNGTTWTPAASGATFSETAQGLEYVHAAAIDVAGNQSAWSTASAIQIDRGTPSVPTVSGGNGAGWSAAASLTVTAAGSTDALSPIHYEYHSLLNGGSYGSVTAGPSLAVSAIGVTEVQFRAVDAAGNVSAWSTVDDNSTVQLDHTAPTTPSVTGGGASWTNTSPIALAASGSTDTPSGIARYEYDVMVGVGVWAGSVTGSSVSVTTNGDRTYRFRTVDRAGNTSAWSSLVQARLDLTAPPAPTQSGAIVGWQNLASETITPSSTDALSGTVSYDWQTSTDGGTTWSGQGSGATFAVTAETTTLVQSRAHDAAGNASSWSASATVKLDRSAPTGLAVAGGALGWQNVASVTVSASGASDPLSGVGSYSYSLDGGASWAGGTSVTVTSEGETIVQFTVTDAVGNVSAPVSNTVRIERTLPSAPSVSGGSLAWTHQPVTFSAAGTSTAASGIAGYEYRTSLNGGLFSAPVAATNGTTTVSTDGTTTVQFRAVSNAGQSSSWRPTVSGAGSTAMIDTVAPTAPAAAGGSNSWQVGPVLIQATGGSDALSGVVGTLHETSSDNVTWSAPSAGASVSVSAAGLTYVRFARFDAAGNVGPYSSVGAGATAKVDLAAPTVPTVDPNGATIGVWTTDAAVTLTPSSTDDSGVPPTYEQITSTDGGTTWSAAASTSGETITAEGITWVRFRALDAAGNQSAYSAVSIVMLDRSAPTGMAVTGGSSIWLDVPSVTVAAGGATDAGSGVAGYRYSIDSGSTWSPGTSVTIAAVGETIVDFQVVDVLGNATTSTAAMVRIDHSAPTVPTVSGGLGLLACGASATITAAGSTDAGSGLDHYESRISTDGGATYGSQIAVGDTVSLSITGTYTVQFRAVDVLGFASAWGPATDGDANQACIA